MKTLVYLLIVITPLSVFSQTDHKAFLNGTPSPNENLMAAVAPPSDAEIDLSTKYIEDLKCIDVEKDGIDELVVVTNYDGSTQIGEVIIYSWAGTSFEIFWSSGEIGGYPYGIQIADIDNDNDDDILLACNGLKWLRNDGSTFTNMGNILGTTPDEKFMVNDQNNDNLKDIVHGGPGSNSGYAIVQKQINSSQEFNVIHTFENGTEGSNMIHAIDVANNGQVDVLNGELYSGDIFIFRNDGNFNYSKVFDYSFENRIFSLGVGDLDNDELDDFIVAEAWSKVHFFKNQESTFQIEHSGSEIGSAFSTALKDVNNDFRIDVLVAAFSPGVIYLYENQGNFEFAEKTANLTSSANYGLTIGDFDGDGFDDLAYGEDPVLIQFNVIETFQLTDYTGIYNTFKDTISYLSSDTKFKDVSPQTYLSRHDTVANDILFEYVTLTFTDNLFTDTTVVNDTITVTDTIKIEVTDTVKITVNDTVTNIVTELRSVSDTLVIDATILGSEDPVNILIYPNPARDHIFIKTNSDSPAIIDFDIRIFDSAGKEYLNQSFSENPIEIPLSLLGKRGLFFIELIDGDDIITVKKILLE